MTSTALRRVLALPDLAVISAAAIGPAFSLATTFGAMAAYGGPRTPLALAATAAVMGCVAAGYRRLGEDHPSAGSSYAWVRAAFGATSGGYSAWVLLVANVFAILATSVPAGAYTLALLAPGTENQPLLLAVTSALWVALASVVLALGMRPTAFVTLVLLVAELAILGASAAAAYLHPLARAAAAAAPPDACGFLGAMVVGIWMLDGWEVSASTAEEAQGTGTQAGTGGLAGLAVTAVILIACMTAYLRLGPPAAFAQHEADAMAYVARQLGGGVWSMVITLTVLVSLAASLQTTLVYLTRTMYALGRDEVLPSAFGRLDERDQPAMAIWVLAAVGIVSSLAVGLSPTVKAGFDFVLNGTSFFLGLLFLLSSLAAVRLFADDPGKGRFDGVVLPAAGALALAVILAASVVRDDPATRMFIASAALGGLPLAWWRVRTIRTEASSVASSN